MKVPELPDQKALLRHLSEQAEVWRDNALEEVSMMRRRLLAGARIAPDVREAILDHLRRCAAARRAVADASDALLKDFEGEGE